MQGKSLAVNTDFARQVVFLAEQLDCSERYVAGLLHQVMSENPNIGTIRCIEEAIREFHRHRRQLADSIRYILEAAALSSSADSQLLKHLDLFVRQHLLPPQGQGNALSFVSRILKELGNLETPMNKTQAGKQCATSNTVFQSGQGELCHVMPFASHTISLSGGRLGFDVLKARFDSLKYERRSLLTSLLHLGRMGYMSPQEIPQLVDLLHNHPNHSMTYDILPIVLAAFDLVDSQSTGGIARKKMISDPSIISYMKRKLDVSCEWKEPGLKATILLKWTLFLTEMRYRDPSLEDRDGFKSDELETQIWNAVQGDCFTFLCRNILLLQKKQSTFPLTSLATNIISQERDTQVEPIPVETRLAVFEAYEVLVRTLITYASSELRKIKQRQEDLLLASTRPDRSRTWRGSVLQSQPRPADTEKTGTPRNDIAFMFSFIGLLYSALPPDYALPYWGSISVTGRRIIHSEHQESNANKLPSFLQWAVWSTQPRDFDMLTALFDMLSGLAKGQQCSELAYNFLVRGSGENLSGAAPSTSTTPIVTGPAVSWSAMFALLESWVASGSNSRPNQPTILPLGSQFGPTHTDGWQSQPQPAQAPPRLALTPQDVLVAQSFLRLLSVVADNSFAARLSISGHARFRAIPTLVALVPLNIPLELKGTIFDTLAAFCTPAEGLEESEICKSIWTLMERLEVINVRGTSGLGAAVSPVKGVEVELEEVESAFKIYPATMAFLRLLSTLVHVPKDLFWRDGVPQEPSGNIPDNLGNPYRTPGVSPYTYFVIDNVFLNISRREYLNPSDRWQTNDLCLSFIERCLAGFNLDFLAANDIQLTKDTVKQLIIHPGYDIMTRLLTQSPLQSSILNYLVEGVDGFDKGLAEEEPFFRSTIIRVLRVLERVLQLQDLFLDVLVPIVAELPVSTGVHRSVSSFVRFDQALLFSPDYVPAALAYVAYPAHHEAVFLSVKILSLLITPSTTKQLAVLVDRSSDSLRILDGFAHVLDAETLVDPEDAEIVASKVAGAGAPDPGEFPDELTQAARMAILDLFIEKTAAHQSFPNIAHFILFGRIDPDHIQDSRALGARRSCIHSLLDLLNAGIPRLQKDSNAEYTGSQGTLFSTAPLLAERCYRVIYHLCKHPRTSDYTTRYLRFQEDFFLRHLASVPPKPLSSSREPFIEVLYSDGSRVATSVSLLCSFLRLRSWVFDLVALELLILSQKGLQSNVSELLDLLFSGDTDPDEGDPATAAFRPFHDLGQSHARLIGFLQSLDIDWCDSMVVQPVDIQFLEQLNLQTCVRPDDTGCMVVDRTAVISLLSAAKNSLLTQGAIITPTHAQQLSAETSYILGSCAVENHRRQVGHAIASCYDAWRRVVDVILVQCFSRVPDTQQEHLLLDLLQALPIPLRSPATEESTTIVLAETIFTAMTKLREARFRDARPSDSITQGGSIPAERLYGLLRDLLGCMLDRKHHYLVRGNLYASLMHYLDMIADDPASSSLALSTTTQLQDSLLSISLNSTAPQTFTSSSSLTQGTFSLLHSSLDRLVSFISKDALSGAEVWKTVAYLLLDALVQLPGARAAMVGAMFQAGYLNGFVQSLGEGDQGLQAVLQPNPGEFCFVLVLYIGCVCMQQSELIVIDLQMI